MAFLPLLLILFIIFLEKDKKKKFLLKQIIQRRKKGEGKEMLELAKRFVGKECLVYAFDSTIVGTIVEIIDGAILVENKGNIEAVNLDFIVRIKEYPKGKNGKKKMVVG